MTREEAIEVIKDIYNYTKWDTYTTNEARTMAIKALEQKPSEIIHGSTYGGVSWGGNYKPQESSVEIVNTEESNDNGTKYLNINVSDGEVKRNPDVVRLCSDVGILEYVKPYGDVISRQVVYEVLNSMLDDSSDNKRNQLVSIDSIADEIAELPSINPKELKTGHWIDNPYDKDFSQCSECGSNWEKSIIENCNMDYCPNCGAKMVEEQESEDCRNCKKWEDCPCGKEGHESGTSQGYSIGECKDFEPQESDHKCHTCKHYTSGEYDGSCGSYICKGHSDWESEDKE